ncbi:MAG: DUF835 domain-containing protein [Methanomassiliicoccales archaeon]
MKSFIVLPGQALTDLREELELIVDEGASGTLERFGYRAGLNLIRDLGVECSPEELKGVLPQLWYEAGLSGMSVESLGEEMTFLLTDPVEGMHRAGCDFARGYLMGMISRLLDERYTAEGTYLEEGYRLVLRPQGQVHTTEGMGRPERELETGYSYLIEDDDPHPAFRLFEDYITHGRAGMCISREYPEKLKEKFDLGNASMLWLSYDRDIGYVREPTNIPLIYSEVKSFLDAEEDRIVLISGLEYMISQSTFIKVLKFVQLLNENVAVRDSLLLLPISPETLDDKEIKMLERELKVLRLD